jgi:Uma2 family endonuclease
MSTLMQELPRRHRITVEHFYRMGDAGLFAEDERVELIEGEIIDVPPMGHRHAGTTAYLAQLLTGLVAGRALVRQQLPLRLGDQSEPLPDIVVVKSRGDYYMKSHPVAADVVLVVEVSSTTLPFDRNVKVPMYARHGVAEAWVVDVNAARISYYRSPDDGAYTVQGTAPLAGRHRIDAIDVDLDLAPLAELLPPT